MELELADQEKTVETELDRYNAGTTDRFLWM